MPKINEYIDLYFLSIDIIEVLHYWIIMIVENISQKLIIYVMRIIANGKVLLWMCFHEGLGDSLLNRYDKIYNGRSVLLLHPKRIDFNKAQLYDTKLTNYPSKYTLTHKVWILQIFMEHTINRNNNHL